MMQRWHIFLIGMCVLCVVGGAAVGRWRRGDAHAGQASVKIVQIAVVRAEGRTDLYALGENGRVYDYIANLKVWNPLPLPPIQE